MVDVVSIIIAAVSLVGSLVAAGFTGWISYYIDQVKRRAEAKKLIHKYRDPLSLAAYDLQSRIFGLVQTGLLAYVEDEDKKELVYVYTAFLVGQYLSWTFILRRQAQFVRFSTDKTNQQLNHVLDTITQEFSTDKYQGQVAFTLWRGQQMAIGELMTLEDSDELYPMGFAAFSQKYHSDSTFQKWFHPISHGIDCLRIAREQQDKIATYRLRRLQHLLIDLVLLLDNNKSIIGQYAQLKVDAAHECKCDGCPGVKIEKPPGSGSGVGGSVGNGNGKGVNTKLPEP